MEKGGYENIRDMLSNCSSDELESELDKKGYKLVSIDGTLQKASAIDLSGNTVEELHKKGYIIVPKDDLDI